MAGKLRALSAVFWSAILSWRNHWGADWIPRRGACASGIFPGQIGDAAVPARATLDVHGAHIGRQVVLLFEGADPRRPIIVGCMQRADGWPSHDQAARVEVESDGARFVVSAKEQLVLQCGKASITLTRAGKILIQGTYVSSRSSGAHRIKGGSVQIN